MHALDEPPVRIKSGAADAALDVQAHSRDSAARSDAPQVIRWSDGSYLEDQDHWWLSGIHRDVYLLAKPHEHVSDFFATTPLELDAASGALTAARCAHPITVCRCG